MKNINASIWFDNRLAFHDIVLSKEHSNMLYKQKIISHRENRMIQKGLKQIESEMINDQFYFSDELEDIHMHIEARLIELIGDTGKKLHTARSRNDQVATSFKMWVRDELDSLLILIKNLQASIIKQAEAHINTILPGFTHRFAKKSVRNKVSSQIKSLVPVHLVPEVFWLSNEQYKEFNKVWNSFCSEEDKSLHKGILAHILADLQDG